MPETNTAISNISTTRKVARQESDRTVMIYTGYVISALLLLGAVAYHFSIQLMR